VSLLYIRGMAFGGTTVCKSLDFGGSTVYKRGGFWWVYCI
jgi:hypothetical protein